MSEITVAKVHFPFRLTFKCVSFLFSWKNSSRPCEMKSVSVISNHPLSYRIAVRVCSSTSRAKQMCVQNCACIIWYTMQTVFVKCSPIICHMCISMYAFKLFMTLWQIRLMSCIFTSKFSGFVYALHYIKYRISFLACFQI